MVPTLCNRIHSLVSNNEDWVKENNHIQKVLRVKGYSKWALKITNENDKAERQKQKQASIPSGAPPPLVGLPYVKGLFEELQRMFKKKGINVFFKPANNLRQFLVKP